MFFGAIILCIGEAAHSASWAETLGMAAVALAAGTWLMLRQLRLPVPLLPLDLYRRPMFALSSLTAMCSFAAQGLSFVSLPFLFQLGMGAARSRPGCC